MGRFKRGDGNGGESAGLPAGTSGRCYGGWELGYGEEGSGVGEKGFRHPRTHMLTHLLNAHTNPEPSYSC